MEYSDFKIIYLENIFLIIILLFVVIYLIFNYKNVIEGNFTSDNLVKSILITGIITLIIHLFLTWDDNNISELNNENKEIIIPKFKLGNLADDNSIKNSNGNSKYKIINNSLENINKLVKNNLNNEDKYDNQNIFISHKNIGKYGIKF